MGTDPFLLSTSVIGVMSQRLLRTLCPHCKTQKAATESEMEALAKYLPKLHIGSSGAYETFQPVGCPACENTGYRGRTAVHELMPVTSDVASAIARQESMDSIREIAAATGYEPMQDSAMRLVLAGVTTVEEARRHVFFDNFAKEVGKTLRLAA
jgi:type IV pilus assembly protein PilB